MSKLQNNTDLKHDLWKCKYMIASEYILTLSLANNSHLWTICICDLIKAIMRTTGILFEFFHLAGTYNEFTKFSEFCKNNDA